MSLSEAPEAIKKWGGAQLRREAQQLLKVGMGVYVLSRAQWCRCHWSLFGMKADTCNPWSRQALIDRVCGLSNGHIKQVHRPSTAALLMQHPQLSVAGLPTAWHAINRLAADID
jgi:hypothetical protein